MCRICCLHIVTVEYKVIKWSWGKECSGLKRETNVWITIMNCVGCECCTVCVVYGMYSWLYAGGKWCMLTFPVNRREALSVLIIAVFTFTCNRSLWLYIQCIVYGFTASALHLLCTVFSIFYSLKYL